MGRRSAGGATMWGYAVAYRLGITPWERHSRATRASIDARLDREEAERSRRPLGRALDLGCGRGVYTALLAERGWEAVGIDNIPDAINAARRRVTSGAMFVVGDVTDLEAAGLGPFDFFLDVGCFQGLKPSSGSPRGGASHRSRTPRQRCSSSPSRQPGCAPSSVV